MAFPGRIAAIFATAAFLLLGACATQQQVVSEAEDHLAAAGFISRPANTPQRQAMLKQLPPHQFLRRVRGDSVTYVYADPLVCNCLYVGDQAAFARYQAYRQQKQLLDQQQMIALEYQDASWNWGAWGWGPRVGYGPFGPGYWGPGW